MACKNNAISVPPITASSQKLPDWPIREAIRPWKIMSIGNWDSMQGVNHLIHYTIGEAENWKDGTNRESVQKN